MKLTVFPLLDTSPESLALTDNLQPRQFVDLLDQHKALIFSSSANSDANGGSPPLLTPNDFGEFLVSLQLEYYPYIGGAAPRTVIPLSIKTTAASPDIVFTANESPPDQPIPFHHELAQTPNPPEYIFFYCHTPPDAGSGGQTPLIDSTAVYRFAVEHHPDFMAKLKEHGARYIRTLPAVTDPSSPIGRSYQQTWNVTNADELEKRLSQIKGCSWQWLSDGSVRITSEAVPATRLVPDHCQNYVYQHAFANSIVAAHLGWQDSRNDRHEALRFGDMERMDEAVLESIADFMQKHRVLYDWKQGDIMAIQNRLVMHSRNPFTGPRRIFASIWGPPLPQVSQQLFNNEKNNGIAIGTVPDSFLAPLDPSDPLVFGFWKIPKDRCADVCYQAIEAGYRRLDCACDYGNEVQVGEGIARAVADGLCSRADLFITSKLWNTYHSPLHVPLAFDRTLNDLQLSYLDEYLIHFPISMEFVPLEVKYPPEWTNMEGKMVLVPNDMGATWKAMEDLVEKGLTRSIGVCNFSTQLLRQLLATATIRPSTLQIELHPHNSQERLLRFARDAGMRVTAFSVLGASSYLELDMATNEEVLMDDPVIVKLAQSVGKSPAQVLLRWALQRNTLPLCKTLSPERMRENRSIFDFYLPGSAMKAINALNKNRRYNDPGAFCEPGMGTFCPIYD